MQNTYKLQNKNLQQNNKLIQTLQKVKNKIKQTKDKKIITKAFLIFCRRKNNMIEQNDAEKQNDNNQQAIQNKIGESSLVQNHEQIHNDDQAVLQNQVVEKLSVQIFPKQKLENPQKAQNNDPQSFVNNIDPYGPFNQSLDNNSFSLKNVNQSINYEIEISPILNKISPKRQSFKDPHKTKTSRNKKSSNILTQESNHDLQFSKTDQAELQKQILALAKNIRQKVKRKQHKKEHSPEQIVSPIINTDKKIQAKQTDPKLRKIFEKRHSIFEKYSHPRSVGIDLTQLQKEQAKLKAGKYTIQRIYNQQPFQQSTQNVENVSEKLQNSIKIENRSQSKTQSHKQRNVPQLPKLKLNFDKTHHKYQMTEFRKNIIKEKKDRQMVKSLMIKQKEEALQKRRQIYNTSRYHPVGIRLSSLRTSRMPNIDVNIKNHLINTEKSTILEEEKQFSSLSLLTPQKQGNTLNYQSQRKILNNLPQMYRTPQKLISQSEVNTSLTFNFSFSDPLNLNSEAKTQSQIVNEVSILTKQLQNDSDLREKIQKGQINQQKIVNQNKIQPKKWAQIDKQMTQSKHIEEVTGLHNSSMSQNNEEQNYNDVELQYSYI